MKDFGRNLLKGLQIGFGICLSLVLAWGGASFAAAAWGALPNAGTTLSSTAWNDVVSQINTLAGAMGVSNGDVSLGAGKVLSAGKIQLTDSVTAGSACPLTGAVSKDSAGSAVICKAGTWSSLSVPGPTGAVGPQGPAGATGPQGAAGNSVCPSGQTLNVCLYHEHFSPSYGWSNTGWKCAPLGTATAKAGFGDDSGYTNQSAQVKIVCM